MRPDAVSGLGSGFGRLWLATGISGLGDGVRLGALPLLTAVITRSPLQISGVAVAQALPWLLVSLPSGVLVDRRDKRRLIMGANLVRAALAGLTASVLAGRTPILLLDLAAFGLTAATTVAESASQALLPELVRAPDLERANTRPYAAESAAAQFAGPPLGSALFAVARAAPFAIDTASFLSSGAVLLSLRSTRRAAPEREARSPASSMRGQITEALGWLWRQPVLRTLALVAVVNNVGSELLFGIFPLFALQVMHLRAAEYGLLFGAYAAGAAGGSLLATRAKRLLRDGPVITAPRAAPAGRLPWAACWPAFRAPVSRSDRRRGHRRDRRGHRASTADLSDPAGQRADHSGGGICLSVPQVRLGGTTRVPRPGGAGPSRRPLLTSFADALDRFLLPLVVLAAAAGIARPEAGRHLDAGNAILITLAVLVLCTGASMTFRDIGAVKTASRRLVVALATSTVALPAAAWLASHLVSAGALRGGVLAAGVAPAEVASVALTGLAGSEAALAAGLLVASTVVTVLLAGPILGLLGAHPATSQLGLLAILALVIALPLLAGAGLRTLDPLGGREQPALRAVGAVSLLVLLWEVASELHLAVSDTRVVAALLLYLACGAGLGALLGTGAPPARRTAILLPTAMRDFAVAAGIAASAFGAPAAAPLGVYGVLVLVFGTVTVALIRRRRR